MGSDRPAIITGKQRATYRVLDELGRGAMGVVYRAEQVDDRGRVVREVAIKMIRPDVAGPAAAKQFRREITSAISLRSQYTVTVFEFGETDAGELFYVMELVRGPTLRRILDQTPRLALDQVAEIGRQVCEALDEAHHLPNPVVHRDLKPGNLLVERWDDRVCVKVSDFGIAKVAGGDTATSSPLDTSASAGTPRYMAPEQCRGGAVDGRADLYSLGVILYEALAGRPPFIGDQMAVMYQHAHQPPPPLPASVPVPIRSVIEKLLAKNPDERPATAEQARQEIDRAWKAADALAAGEREIPTQKLRPVFAPPAGVTSSRSRRRYLPAAAALAAVVAATGLALGGHERLRRTVAAWWTPAAVSAPRAERLASIPPNPVPAPDAGPQAAIHSADAARRTKVAVVAFRNERDADRDNDWIGKALQASFSTELNKVREIRVVSRDLVDEASVTAKSASAVARSLGAQKLVTGSFAVHRDQIRVDVWLVDADSGVQDMAEMVEGRLDEFFGLQKRIALAMLEHIPVAVERTERQAIAAKNLSENPSAALDAYKFMLQGEGLYDDEPGAGEPSAGGPQTRLRPPGRGVGPLSRVLQVLSPWPQPASAQEPIDPQATIRQILEDYRLALQEGDLDGISRAKGQLSQGRRKGLEQYYQIAEDLRVEFDAVEIAPIDERHFTVSYLRRDEFADRRTGEKVSLEVHLQNLAVLDGDQWRLTDKRTD